MATLKEVKNRIVSVSNMKKITTARQMIASAQLHHAQQMREKAAIYKDALEQLIAKLLTNSEELPATLTVQHPESAPVAIVIISSNTGMCGPFNANIIKTLHNLYTTPSKEKYLLFPIGKKIREAVQQAGYPIGYETGQNADQLVNKAPYQETIAITNQLIQLYHTKKVKQVKLIYYHYKNNAIQEIISAPLLPYPIPQPPAKETPEDDDDYIFEPSPGEIVEQLIPMAIRATLYYTLTESQASEHAARTIAMQLATENAEKLLTELQLTKNKLRQQNITSELLDIIGGSFA